MQWSTATTVAGKSGVMGCLSLGSGKFLAVGPGFIIKSVNSGATWANKTPAGSHNYNSITTDGTTILAIGPDVSNQVAVSTDEGENWTLHAIDAGNAFAGQDVCSPAVGTFVAVANSAASATKRAAVSTDSGATWTLKNTPAGFAPFSVAAKDASNLTSSDGASDTMTSSDGGTTWTKHAGALSAITPRNTFTDTIRFSSGLGEYIVGGYNGSFQAVVYQSSDGITFSLLGSAVTTHLGWYGFAIADAFGGFFGSLPFTSGLSPTPTIIGYSDDAAATWTADDTTFSPGASGIWGPGAWDADTNTVVFFDFDSATVLIGQNASVISLTPIVGPRQGGTVVTITGTGFTGVTSVTFGGTAAVDVTVVSDTSITCVTPPHAVALVDVEVVGVGTLTNAFSFVSVLRVSPRSGTFAGGTSVTITGFGFNDATGVVFDPDGTANDATDFVIVSNTEITVTTPVHATGRVDVEVTGVDTGTDLYTYVVPSITLPPIPYLSPPALGQSPTQGSSADVSALMVKPWLSWLRTVKKTIEDGPTTPTPAEQVIGVFSVDNIPQLPWTKILKAGSSLGDLETRSASDLSSGTLAVARLPALSGDATAAEGTGVTVLATVNSTPGSYGSGTQIPIINVNGKGLVTSVTNQPIQTGALTRANDTNITLTLTGTPDTALLKDVLITAGWSGTLAVSRGGTGTGTAFTAGSVVFAGSSGVYSQDNANFFWDDTNNRLGIGTAAPSERLHCVLGADIKLVVETTANIYAGVRLKNPGRSWITQVEFVGTSKWRLVDETAGIVPVSVEGGGVNDALFIKASGNIGIGTSSPATLLDVSSTAPSFQMTDTTASAKSLRIVTDANLANFYEAAGVAGDILTLDLSNKRVGVRLTNPNFALEIKGDVFINANNGGIAVSGITPESNRIIAGDLLGLGTAGAGRTHSFQILTTGGSRLRMLNPAGEVFSVLDSNGHVGLVGVIAPTAVLHLPAGTATANTAPLKLTSGTSLTTAEVGAIEFTTDDFFATITTGAARKAFILDDGARLTSGKIPIATTNGRLIDGQTPLAGTKVYYVSDTSGGAVTRKLTFTAGILTAET